MGMPLLAKEWPRWHLQAIGPIFQHLYHLAHVYTELCAAIACGRDGAEMLHET